jgi:hypothetical protein
MCVSVCLLQVNGVEEFYDVVLLELCCDGGGVKLFVVVPLMNSNDGKINRMLLWMFLKGVRMMEWINGRLWKTKYTHS